LAALDLDLTSNVGLGVELLTGFYDTGVTPVSFSLNPGDDFGTSLPSEYFNFNIDNTYFSLENLVGGPVLELLDRVQTAFEPLMPVIDMITSEVPLVSSLSKKLGNGEVTYLDAISWFGEGAENAVTFVEFLADTVSLADEITGLINTGSDGGEPKLYLGGFSAPADQAPAEVASVDALAFTEQDPAQAGEDAADAGVLERLNQIFAGVGMNVPLLSNPSAQLGQLLFGGEVDLITWDVPDLQASFDFRQSFPVFPPLYVSLFGGVAFETNFDLGYDTRGIRLAMADGGSPSDLLNGVFLVDDNHADYWVATGDETAYSSPIGDAEMGMTAEIGAGAELNVVVAQAGVEGGVRGNLLADLADPDPDGKVYLDEFASNLVRGPECIFDFSGALNVFLEAFIKVGIDTPFGFVTLFKDRFELAKATILEWGSVSCPPVEPSLGQLSGDVLTLNMGDRAGLVLDDGSIEDGDEVFVIDVIRNEDGSVVVGAGSGLVVAAYNFTQAFVGVTRVEFDAGIGNDSVIFTPEVTVDVVGAGGDGDDNLVGGSGNNHLEGNAGSDAITGRAGNDTLVGGSGNDIIYGFGGRDSIDGGAGDDQLFGDDDIGDLDSFAASNPEFNAGSSAGDNRDTIFGGDGDDSIVAGADADQVDAGDGDDAVAAGDGNDTVEGGRGNDQILGEGGRDTLYGDDQAGEITNGDEVTHADKIQGGDGADRIFGGTGNDLLYAVDEDVLETGSVSGALMDGLWASYIEGGDGDDTIYATNDNDMVRGGDGADYIALGEGDNWAYGGKSSDALIDGSGNSTLLGGTGDDVFDGGEGHDYMEGGPGDDQIYGREGEDTIWGGTTDNDIMPGAVTLSHYDLIVAEGVSDTSQFGFRTTLQADSCAPEIQFAPPVYPEATGPVSVQIYHDADWDRQRDAGEALIEGERWHINLWSVNAAGEYVEQVDFAQGIESGTITLANNALVVGDYVAELTPMQASDWQPTDGLATYRQAFTIDSLSDPLPVLTFGFSKRADLTGTVTKGDAQVAAAGEIVFLDADGDWQRDAGEQYTYTDANGDYVFSDLMVGQDYDVVLESPDDEYARLLYPASGAEGYATVTIAEDGATADFAMLPVTLPVVSGVGLASSNRGAQIDWIDDGSNQVVPIDSAVAYDQVVVSMCGIDLAQEALQLGPVLVYDLEQWVELGTSISPLSATQSLNANGDIVLNLTQSLGAGGYLVFIDDKIFLDKGLDKEITLDGEWDNGRDRFVSGDGVAGGDFLFSFQIAGTDKEVAPEDKGDEGAAKAALTLEAPTVQQASIGATATGSTATITGTLWLDSALDAKPHHRMENGEPVLGNTSVTLVTKDGVAVANTMTNTDGQFSFVNVAAGEYRVEITDTDQWSTTSLTSSVVGEEWLVARYFGTGTTAIVYGNALDLVDIEKADILQTVALPSDKVVDKTPVMVRDVAAIGSNVYTSYQWDNGGKPAGALMLTNTEDPSVTQPIWSTALGGVYVGLDAIDETTLLGITNEGEVRLIDTSTAKHQLTGSLQDATTKTNWVPVGDVAAVSPTEAYAVVVPKGSPSSTQYLATFNPLTNPSRPA
jgi:Ca2+-binding RTX toxin-like protein